MFMLPRDGIERDEKVDRFCKQQQQQQQHHHHFIIIITDSSKTRHGSFSWK
jgi:hypothetical protein